MLAQQCWGKWFKSEGAAPSIVPMPTDWVAQGTGREVLAAHPVPELLEAEGTSSPTCTGLCFF